LSDLDPGHAERRIEGDDLDAMVRSGLNGDVDFTDELADDLDAAIPVENAGVCRTVGISQVIERNGTKIRKTRGEKRVGHDGVAGTEGYSPDMRYMARQGKEKAGKNQYCDQYFHERKTASSNHPVTF